VKNKPNKFNIEAFEKSKKVLEAMYPQISRRGFFISNLNEAKVLPEKMKSIAVGAVCEIAGDSLTLRSYRRPKGPSDLSYKVDEYRDVNKEILGLPSHREIKNHHIKHDVPEDMMSRNQMTFEFIFDGEGDLRPNIQPNGMITAYVNFPDPTVETIKEILAGWSDKDDSSPK
jgi:hypothetical protein